MSGWNLTVRAREAMAEACNREARETSPPLAPGERLGTSARIARDPTVGDLAELLQNVVLLGCASLGLRCARAASMRVTRMHRDRRDPDRCGVRDGGVVVP